MHDLIVVGGGAAGFFAALSAKRMNYQGSVAVIEKGSQVLTKVKISGGGRCNVTHNCFDPIPLAKHYPRGEKELLAPFHRFQPRDTIGWFESRGVKLKTEEDGRIFPVSNSSETIISCLIAEANRMGVEQILRQKIESVQKEGDHFVLHSKIAPLASKRLILATGSSPEGYILAKQLGHSIESPVPSLFTFNIPDSPLQQLMGVCFERISIGVKGTPFTQTGPLLITHFGFSGPAPLKLSAWAARYLHDKGYFAELMIDWLPDLSIHATIEMLHRLKKLEPQKTIVADNPFHFPKSFWKLFLQLLEGGYDKPLRDVSMKDLHRLAEKLHRDIYVAKGKTTNKEEFVTCGGVNLKEVNFKTMESKICPSLFFAGEVLDIDGVTGGFNFQNAWTTGFIAGSSAFDREVPT